MKFCIASPFSCRSHVQPIFQYCGPLSKLPLLTMTPLTPEGLRSRARRACRTESQKAADRVRANEAARRRRANRTTGDDAPLNPTGHGLPLPAIAALRPHGLRTPWRREPCAHCGALLLSTETASWCCRNGSRLLEPLPPLPPRIQNLIATSPVDVSKRSRELNYLFALSAIGVSNGVKSGWSEYKGVHHVCLSVFLYAHSFFDQRRWALLACHGGPHLSSGFLNRHY